MKNIFFLLAIISFIGCKNKTKEKDENTVSDPVRLSMNRNADSLLLDPKINAVSIGIYKDGKIYTGHYGELDKEKGNPPTDSTIYEIASVSKTFAGILVARAVMDDTLDLEEDIRKYLKDDYPNLEYKGKPIKIKHLITHTSRLPKFLPDSINVLFEHIDENLPFNIYKMEKKYNRQKFLQDLHSITIDTVPGFKYGYSNIDTELIAHILENVYGETYEDLLKKYIWDVAGMPDTRINLTEEQHSRLANGYGETNKLVPHMANSLWGAAGGLKSTVPDMIRYMKFQLDESNPLIRKSHEVIYDNKGMKLAYYWPVHTEEEGVYYGHHGGAFGMQNWFFVIPEHHMGITVITNQSDMQTADKLIKTVGDILEDIRQL